jgi:ribonuclease HI
MGLIEKVKPSNSTYQIYIGAHCIGWHGVGGLCVVIISPDRTEQTIHGAITRTKKRHMELLAVVKALRGFRDRESIEIRYDSEHLHHGIDMLPGSKARGWKKSNYRRYEDWRLWRELEKLTHFHRLTFVLIDSDAGAPMIERVRRSARNTAQAHRLGSESDEYPTDFRQYLEWDRT